MPCASTAVGSPTSARVRKIAVTPIRRRETSSSGFDQSRLMEGFLGEEGPGGGTSVIAGEAAVDEIGPAGRIKDTCTEHQRSELEALLDAERRGSAARLGEGLLAVFARGERAQNDGVTHLPESALGTSRRAPGSAPVSRI